MARNSVCIVGITENRGQNEGKEAIKKGIGYIRVSTEGQAREGVSLDNQRITDSRGWLRIAGRGWVKEAEARFSLIGPGIIIMGVITYNEQEKR